MKYGFIKCSAVSPRVTVADCKQNTANICYAVNNAYKSGVKICVFPELCISGYSVGDLFRMPSLLNAVVSSLKEIIEASVNKDMLVFVGAPIENNGKIYDTAVAVYNGKILGIVPKSRVYDKRVFSEYNGNNSTISILGSQIPFGNKLIFRAESLKEMSVSVVIGEEATAIDTPAISHALAGANVIVNLNAYKETCGKTEELKNQIIYASKNQIAGYVVASAGEGESTSDGIFGGYNLIAENGIVLNENNVFEEDMVISEIDVKSLEFERSKSINDYGKDNGYATIWFDIPIVTTRLSREFSKTPFIPSGKMLEEKCKLILELQSRALARRISHCHAKTVTIGVSGGLDSTLALIACVNAMKILGRPSTDVVAVTMPCFGTTKRTKGNADKLMEALNVTSLCVDIKKAVTQHFKDIGHAEDNYDVTYENAQARERTQVIMDISNQYGGFVVGTGDISELALGWATYNGDHMAMYGVNAGIVKTLIPAVLGYYSNTIGDKKLKNTLIDIVDTEISPELLPPDKDGKIAQKTEDKVGPYRLHDFYLYSLLIKGYSPSKTYYLAEQVFNGEFDKQTIYKWLKIFITRFFQQQYKRNCLPEGVKVEEFSLSPRGDFAMPGDANANVWLKDLEGEESF